MATESTTSTRHSSTTTCTTMTTAMASTPPVCLVPEHLHTNLPIHTQPSVIIITSTLEVRKGRRKKMKWFAQGHSVHTRVLPPSPAFTSHSPASAPRTMVFKTFCDKVAGVSLVPFVNLHTHDREENDSLCYDLHWPLCVWLPYPICLLDFYLSFKAPLKHHLCHGP